MPPKSKSKGKKAKGATVSVSLMKLSKKAARCNQVPTTPVLELGQTTEGEDPFSSEDRVSQQLTTMMKMLDLSHRVQATKSQQGDKVVSAYTQPIHFPKEGHLMSAVPYTRARLV